SSEAPRAGTHERDPRNLRRLLRPGGARLRPGRPDAVPDAAGAAPADRPLPGAVHLAPRRHDPPRPVGLPDARLLLASPVERPGVPGPVRLHVPRHDAGGLLPRSAQPTPRPLDAGFGARGVTLGVAGGGGCGRAARRALPVHADRIAGRPGAAPDPPGPP